jgi:hypothetical protein
MKKKLLAAGALIGAVGLAPAMAQSVGPSVLNAAGRSATISGNTYEYAIGTVPLMPTYSSSTLVVTGGALQPASTTGIKDRMPALSGIQIFPNPVSTVLNVAPALGGRGLLQMRLFDATGKLVQVSEATLVTGTEQQTLNLNDLAASTYLLKLVWTPDAHAASPASSATYTVQKLR